MTVFAGVSQRRPSLLPPPPRNTHSSAQQNLNAKHHYCRQRVVVVVVVVPLQVDDKGAVNAIGLGQKYCVDGKVHTLDCDESPAQLGRVLSGRAQHIDTCGIDALVQVCRGELLHSGPRDWCLEHHQLASIELCAPFVVGRSDLDSGCWTLVG